MARRPPDFRMLEAPEYQRGDPPALVQVINGFTRPKRVKRALLQFFLERIKCPISERLKRGSLFVLPKNKKLCEVP